MLFVGPSYHLNARVADVQRVVNMMPVVNEVAGSKTFAYLDSIPGLTAFSTPEATVAYLLTYGYDYLLTHDGQRIEVTA